MPRGELTGADRRNEICSVPAATELQPLLDSQLTIHELEGGLRQRRGRMVALGTTGIGPRREAGGTTIAGRSSGGASSQEVGLAAVWVRLAPTIMPSEVATIVSSAWVMSLRLP